MCLNKFADVQQGAGWAEVFWFLPWPQWLPYRVSGTRKTQVLNVYSSSSGQQCRAIKSRNIYKLLVVFGIIGSHCSLTKLALSSSGKHLNAIFTHETLLRSNNADLRQHTLTLRVFFFSPEFAFRHNEASAEKFLWAVIRTRKRCRVGVGEWQRFMDPLRHGDLRDYPECLWETAPLAWPDLSGLLLPHRFQQHVSDQQAEPAQAALTETHGPGLPAHHGLHPQVAVVARGSQFWPALLLPTVHLSQQHKSCLQCYSGFPAA